VTATVVPTGAGVGSPDFTGTVTFDQGSTVLGTSPITSTGFASINLAQFASTYAIGSHSITATYSGDAGFTGSTSSPYNQVVAPPIFTGDGYGCDFSVVNSATNAVANYPEGTSTCNTAGDNVLEVSPDGTHAYLLQPDPQSTTIEVINTATAGVISTINLPESSIDMEISPNGADLYVFEGYPAQVAVISTATDAVVRTIAASPGSSGYAAGMAINPAGTELALAEVSGIQLVNLTTNTASAHTSIFAGAEGVAFSPSGSSVYVASGGRFIGAGGGAITVVSTSSDSITHTYVGLTEPYAPVVSRDGTQVFVAGASTQGTFGTIGDLNLSSGAFTTFAPLATGYFNLALSADGTKLYASSATAIGPGTVSVFSESSHTQLATLSGFPAIVNNVRPFGTTAPTPPPQSQPVRVTTTALPAAIQNVFYDTVLGATNGVAPYTWRVTGGSLPAGLSLSPSGVISGTPSTTATSSTFSVGISDSQSPADTGTATLSVTVTPASTTPPACGGAASSGSSGGPGLHAPANCVSSSNTTAGGTATAQSFAAYGTVTVTAHGTGGLTVGQYGSGPTAGATFRTAGNSFDLALSSSNTFTSVTVVDCAMDFATSLQWWNPAANGGSGAFQAVTPQSYNSSTRCDTITFSATSSPTLAQLDGTVFAGVLPAETVSIDTGGSSPYSLSGTVVSGAITLTSSGLTTTVSGTVILLDANGQPAQVSISASCLLGLCAGTFSVDDAGAGVSFTTPTTVTLGGANSGLAHGTGIVFPGPGLKNNYPLSWEVSVASS
jgi:DNA-binding beta-propeller fold protein YncE